MSSHFPWLPRRRWLLTTTMATAALTMTGCPSVDCEALCQRTLACEVTFAPSDDPDEVQVASGARSELESCALGCAESPTVTVEAAACVDGVEITGNAALCQPPVIDCLGLTEALGTGAAG
jgi:hypothetical protein